MLAFTLLLALPCLSYGFGLAGGNTAITLTDSDVNVMFAKSAMAAQLAKDGAADAQRTFTVQSATSQVVAGVLYTIKLSTNMNEVCTVKVWERTWMTPQREVSGTPSCAATSRRAGGISATTMDMSDVNAQFALAATKSQFLANGKQDSGRTFSIKKATQQVVSGMLYRITFETNMNEECTVTVWEQAWMTPQRQISDGPTCSATPARRMAGGVSQADKNSKEVKDALSFCVTSLNNMENSMFARVQQGDYTVTKQVVAGMLYKFTDVVMATSDCMKGSNTDLSSCNVADNASSTKCSFTVSWQAWRTPQYEMVDWKCA